MHAGTACHHWRRLLRFSVRGLIVLVLVIGAGLGWLVRSAHIQRDAVATIKGADSSVYYDWEWNYREYTRWAPRWLVDLVGVDYFDHVAVVSLPETPTEAMLINVSSLTQVQDLSFNGSSIGDAGLEHLNGLNNLSDLNLRNTKVSDAGLIHLKGLTKLSRVDLQLHTGHRRRAGASQGFD